VKRFRRSVDWDARVALGLFLLSQLEIWLVGSIDGAKAVMVPAMAAMTISLAWRRRSPLVPVLALGIAFAASMVAFAATDDWPGRPESVSMLAVWVLTAYSAAAYGTPRVAALALAVAASLSIVRAALDAGIEWEPISSLFMLIPWGAGVAIRRHRRQAAELRELTRQLEHEREARARAAVVEERTRIARELHDVVAHSVSVIAVQADAAEAALAHDPQRSQAPLAAVKQTAREALVEMRRLLGILRQPDDDPALAPQPGMRDLDSLVEQVRRTGLALELAIEGKPRPLPAAVDLSAYRIVQEGLTNVRKHAGVARARVEVRYGAAELDVAVLDDGKGTTGDNGGGHGLVGVHERVALLGGTLRAGTRPEGGYELRARLPLDHLVA
jgi:signal transduction histidine kinase